LGVDNLNLCHVDRRVFSLKKFGERKGIKNKPPKKRNLKINPKEGNLKLKEGIF